MPELFYVDDDVEDIEIFESAVSIFKEKENVPIELHTFNNGDHFINSLKNYPEGNGWIFLDINMPYKSGFEVLKELREDDDLPQFPVIMFSTSSNINTIETSRHLGATRYAIKPNNFKELNSLLQRVVDTDWHHPAADGDFVIRY